MRENFSRFIRSAFGVIVIGLMFILALAIHLWALIANYNALVQSFELIGFDQKPLSEDPFYGRIFEAMLLGDATQCHLYAGFLVLALAVGFGIMAYFLFNIIMLIRDRKVYLNNGEAESARQAEIAILYNNVPYFIIFSILLIVLAWWDLWLFTYRSLAGIYGIETAEEAVPLIGKLGVSIAEAPDNFALALIRLGGLGYLVATLLTSFFLKFAWVRTKERLIDFEEAIISLFYIENSTQVTRDGQSEATIPVSANNAPMEPEGAEELQLDANTLAVNPPREAEIGVGMDNESNTVGPEQRLERTPDGDNFKTGQPEITVPSDPLLEIPTTHVNAEKEVEIIGGNATIRRSEALANPDRYHVDEDGRFWDRGYYEMLHGSSFVTSTERPEAA